MDDEIPAVTEHYDPATIAFQRKMREIRKQGNDLIIQHEEDNVCMDILYGHYEDILL
jgi:hypothetical protein